MSSHRRHCAAALSLLALTTLGGAQLFPARAGEPAAALFHAAPLPTMPFAMLPSWARLERLAVRHWPRAHELAWQTPLPGESGGFLALRDLVFLYAGGAETREIGLIGQLGYDRSGRDLRAVIALRFDF